MIYMNIDLNEAISKKVISKKDAEWVTNVRITYPGSADLWGRKYVIDSAICKAISSGKVKKIEQEIASCRSAPNVISDDLKAGINGLHNPADGKMYDSKSAYYKGVKAAGCIVMGNDAPAEARKEERGDFDCSKELKEAIQQHLR